MLEYWVTYADATGEFTGAWSFGPPGSAQEQKQGLPAGFSIVTVPQDAIIAPTDPGSTVTVDLAKLKALAAANVGAAAELVRQRFVTPGSGKAMSYSEKAAEARAWADDNAAVTPILSDEATARGMPLAALVAEILAIRAAWVDAERRINAAEMGAKTAITAATNIGAIVNAATVDWAAIFATG